MPPASVEKMAEFDRHAVPERVGIDGGRKCQPAGLLQAEIVGLDAGRQKPRQGVERLAAAATATVAEREDGAPHQRPGVDNSPAIRAKRDFLGRRQTGETLLGEMGGSLHLCPLPARSAAICSALVGRPRRRLVFSSLAGAGTVANPANQSWTLAGSHKSRRAPGIRIGGGTLAGFLERSEWSEAGARRRTFAKSSIVKSG